MSEQNRDMERMVSNDQKWANHLAYERLATEHGKVGNVTTSQNCAIKERKELPESSNELLRGSAFQNCTNCTIIVQGSGATVHYTQNDGQALLETGLDYEETMTDDSFQDQRVECKRELDDSMERELRGKSKNQRAFMAQESKRKGRVVTVLRRALAVLRGGLEMGANFKEVAPTLMLLGTQIWVIIQQCAPTLMN